MRFAYSKLGRSVLLDPGKWGEVGGDNEPLFMLTELARRHPDHEWVVAGLHSGDPGNLPSNVIVPPWPKDKEERKRLIAEEYTKADGAVIWLGQHGTSNIPVPQDKDPSLLTNPQEWSQNYAAPIIRGLNDSDLTRYEPVWLAADARNYLKARDLKWYPRWPILGQYEWSRTQRHYRYGDPRTPQDVGFEHWSVQDTDGFWKSTHGYVYSGLELTGVPRWEDEPQPGFEERVRFGIIINEARPYVNPKKARLTAMQRYVLPLQPDFVHGKWTDKSLATLGVEIDSIPYVDLAAKTVTAKSTFTTPSSGSEWATAKPWEMFAAGVVCFFHPYYDTQGHIIPTLKQAETADDWLKYLVGWLRVESPEQLEERVDAVHSSRETYEWLVSAQRHVLKVARERDMGYRLIEQRLGLPEGGSA